MADRSEGSAYERRARALAGLFQQGWGEWIHRRLSTVRLDDSDEVRVIEEIEFTPPAHLLEDSTAADAVFVPLATVPKEPLPDLSIEDAGGVQVPILTGYESSMLVSGAMQLLFEASRGPNAPTLQADPIIGQIVTGTPEEAQAAVSEIRDILVTEAESPEAGFVFVDLVDQLVYEQLVFVHAGLGQRQIHKITRSGDVRQSAIPWLRRLSASLGWVDTTVLVGATNMHMAATSEMRIEVPDGIRIVAAEAVR